MAVLPTVRSLLIVALLTVMSLVKTKFAAVSVPAKFPSFAYRLSHGATRLPRSCKPFGRILPFSVISPVISAPPADTVSPLPIVAVLPTVKSFVMARLSKISDPERSRFATVKVPLKTPSCAKILCQVLLLLPNENALFSSGIMFPATVTLSLRNVFPLIQAFPLMARHPANIFLLTSKDPYVFVLSEFL